MRTLLSISFRKARIFRRGAALLSALLLLSYGCYPQSAGPVVVSGSEINLSGRCNDLYHVQVLPREELFAQLGMQARGSLSDTTATKADSLWGEVPEKIQFFRFFGKDKYAEEQKVCEGHAWKLFQETMADETFKQLSREDQYAEFDLRWRTAQPSCYYFYRKLAPVLDFQINLPLDGPALLTGVESEILFRTPSQATGIMARRANADLLIPVEVLGRVSCLNKNRSDYEPFWLEQSPMPMVLSQLIWSESYFRTIPGKYPPRELFLLRFHFYFEAEGGGRYVVRTSWVAMQI